MTLNLLFSDRAERWEAWADHLRTALSDRGVEAALVFGSHAPETIDYIIYSPASDVQDFRAYTRLKAVLSMWAGVEKIAPNPTLKVPLTRMVDPGLTQGMVEYVTAHVLRYHLGMDRHIANTGTFWQMDMGAPLAMQRKVGILGLGALGLACARALKGLGFDVTGWSRRPKDISDIAALHGADGLGEVLATSDILVLLLPNTPQTTDLINAETLARLPKGARIINPGRGELIKDEDLLEALACGQISHATLDVFRTEPLPPDHPYWRQPQVTVTPHIAAETRPATAATVIAENIRRGEAGEPFLHLVDRSAGY